MTEKSKRKIVVILTSMLALMLVVFAEWIGEKKATETRGYTVSDDFASILVPASENRGLDFDINSFVNGSGAYLFLPCNVDLSDLSFYSTDADGHYLQRFEEDLSAGSFEICGVRITAMQSDLPSVMITTDESAPTLSELESSDDHSVSTTGKIEILTKDGEKTVSKISMRGRGNISWLEDKKSYQVSMKKSVGILGMKEGRTWELIANAGDYSLLRNEVFLGMAGDMGLAYTPEIKETDLFINGEYRGTYSLCSKVETGKTRVDIGPEDYLYRLGMDPDEYSFCISSNTIINPDSRYAEVRDTTDRVRIARAASYLQHVIDEMEDPDSDLSDMDLTSFAKYYWLQEFSKTTDPTGRSVYFYWIDREQKMYMGPAWDYDRTAGIIEPFQIQHDYLWPDGYTARYADYYVTLFENPVFTKAVRDVYENGGVKEAFSGASAELPGRIAYIARSAEMNFIRWGVLSDEENNKIAATYGDTSYQNQINWLTDWIRMRAEWIEEEMEGTDE